MRKHQLHIGTSGWSYKHWRGTFYPKALKIKDEFEYYRKFFDTVEVNNTFYRLPTTETFSKWKDEVPQDFKFVIKASRFITHMKKLRNPESSALFFERVEVLREKIGAILFQLPPMMKANLDVFEAYLAYLPQTYRYVFEFRNPDWYRPDIFDLLQNYNCAFCIYELDGHLSPIEVTADLVYLRLHGPGKKYQGSYSDQTLAQWAGVCRDWLRQKDVFVYFDNDEKGYAAFNAIKLKELILR